MKKHIHYIILLLTVIIVATSCGKDEPKLEPNKRPTHFKRTVLVYMIGTNTLNYYVDLDINEMIIATDRINLDEYNILTYQATKESNPKLIEISKNGSVVAEKVLIEYSDEYSSVDSQRISQVIHDMQNISPADEYGVIFWSHGMGWIPSKILSDNGVTPTYYGDDYGKHINIDTLADAIPDNLFSFIWMDCCYMSGIELIYELRNKCDYFIGYPTEILSAGMPYDLTMPYLMQPKCDVIGAAKATFDFYSKNANYEFHNCTIAVADMSGIEDLKESSKAILSNSQPLSNTSDLQIYSRGSQGPFYDFRQYIEAMAQHNNRVEYLNSFYSAFEKVMVYKDCTNRFLSININANKYSGISTHAFMNDNSTDEEYYCKLDWYKYVYIK